MLRISSNMSYQLWRGPKQELMTDVHSRNNPQILVELQKDRNEAQKLRAKDGMKVRLRDKNGQVTMSSVTMVNGGSPVPSRKNKNK